MSDKKSKFSGIFQTRQGEDAEAVGHTSIIEPTPHVEEPPPSPALAVAEVTNPGPRPKAKPRSVTPETSRPVGRPRGKRSDVDHVQVTAYIRRDTHLDVKAALLRDQKGRDFSDLTEELLAKWLKSRT